MLNKVQTVTEETAFIAAAATSDRKSGWRANAFEGAEAEMRENGHLRRKPAEDSLHFLLGVEVEGLVYLDSGHLGGVKSANQKKRKGY